MTVERKDVGLAKAVKTTDLFVPPDRRSGVGMRRAALIASVCLALSGCGSSGGPPQVRITGIAPGSTIMVRNDYTYPLDLSVANFLVEQPGTCGSHVDCGQVYLNIDGHACDRNQAYNAITLSSGSSTSTIIADFSFCPPANLFGSSHQLTVSLHLDSGAEVLGPNDVPAESTLPVITTASTASAPSIARAARPGSLPSTTGGPTPSDGRIPSNSSSKP